MSETKIETRCVQAGHRPGNGEPRQVPIIQSTTFRYETADSMADLFNLAAAGYFYSRLQNPTNDTVAAKICELEGGTAAMLTSSGQAASFFSIFNLASAGDHIVAASNLYGGTYNLFNVTMRRMGIDFSLIDLDSPPEEWARHFRPETKAVFAETLSNPSLRVLDIEKFAKLAHDHGVPLIVDNTFPTPYNCRPFEWGADIVIHSTTKYMDGHGSAVGGCIVDSGRFDWTADPGKFAGLVEADPSYHGLSYTDSFGLEGAYITKAVAQLMRDLGATVSPQSAYYLNLGLESLHVRMERHNQNGLRVARFLEQHPAVAWVKYPRLESDSDYELTRKYLPNGCSGVVSCGLEGGRTAAAKFMEALKIFAIATHVADARSCCLHPAGTTHRQLNDSELRAAGVRPELVRLSCGIENDEDLIADLEQALAVLR